MAVEEGRLLLAVVGLAGTSGELLDGDPTGGGAAGLVPSLHRCELEDFQGAPCRCR